MLTPSAALQISGREMKVEDGIKEVVIFYGFICRWPQAH